MNYFARARARCVGLQATQVEARRAFRVLANQDATGSGFGPGGAVGVEDFAFVLARCLRRFK
jgi:hypothetical protein